MLTGSVLQLFDVYTDVVGKEALRNQSEAAAAANGGHAAIIATSSRSKKKKRKRKRHKPDVDLTERQIQREEAKEKKRREALSLITVTRAEVDMGNGSIRSVCGVLIPRGCEKDCRKAFMEADPRGAQVRRKLSAERMKSDAKRKKRKAAKKEKQQTRSAAEGQAKLKKLRQKRKKAAKLQARKQKMGRVAAASGSRGSTMSFPSAAEVVGVDVEMGDVNVATYYASEHEIISLSVSDISGEDAS